MAIEYDHVAPSLDNTNVDNISQQSGVIDQLPSLSLDMEDRDIISNLDLRINDSAVYWNDAKGFDLKNTRARNVRFHEGKIQEKGLYKHQKAYQENQIFVGEESIVSYVTAQIAAPLVVPASSEQYSKLFASDLEKAIKCHGEDVVDLESIIEICVRNILEKRVAIVKFHFDKNFGPKGDIISEALDPEDVILDKNAMLGSNPPFVCHVLKKSVEELLNEYPKKEKEILAAAGIVRKTPKQMTKELAVREVWVTHYDKKNQPQEGVVWYFGNVVLEKCRNPNWLYTKEKYNLLKYPKKPFIFGNLVNKGKHMIDSTTPLEQAVGQQEYLTRRGRQIGENADKANGLLIISTETGLTKDDGQNVTGDPNQKLFVSGTENGKSVDQLVKQLQAQQLPQYVIADKQDARMQVGNIMGTPTDFTGSEANDGDPTLGEVMVKKNQSSGRQDLMVRAVTRMLRHYYQYLVQMMIVWYDEAHDFTYDSGDGEFDYITLKRELIEQGIRVKASKPANPDRSRQEAVALQLVKDDKLSLLDAYKILQLDNPQQLYDNWAKQQADPMSLARDALDVVDIAEARVAFRDIMNGEPVEPKENPSKEYVLSLRKLMINDEFLTAKKAIQNKFVKYVNDCLDSLQERLALEEASEVTPTGDGLRPGAPLPNPNMQPTGPTPGAIMGAPGMPPGGPPPMGPSPSSVFAGVPVPQPGQAPTANAGNPSILPMV